MGYWILHRVRGQGEQILLYLVVWAWLARAISPQKYSRDDRTKYLSHLTSVLENKKRQPIPNKEQSHTNSQIIPHEVNTWQRNSLLRTLYSILFDIDVQYDLTRRVQYHHTFWRLSSRQGIWLPRDTTGSRGGLLWSKTWTLNVNSFRSHYRLIKKCSSD